MINQPITTKRNTPNKNGIMSLCVTVLFNARPTIAKTAICISAPEDLPDLPIRTSTTALLLSLKSAPFVAPHMQFP